MRTRATFPLALVALALGVSCLADPEADMDSAGGVTPETEPGETIGGGRASGDGIAAKGAADPGDDPNCKLVDKDDRGNEEWRCWRRAGGEAATGGNVIRWYLVTVIRILDEVIVVTEQLLYCEDDDGFNGDDPWDCRDRRDTLAAEYDRMNVPGHWDCRKFVTLGSKWVVPDGDIEWGTKHDFYGNVNGRITSNIPAMEAHFNITAKITSGYRCPVGNSRIPKAGANSFHIHGGGYDFVVVGDRWTTVFKDSIIAWAEANGAAEANRYTDGRDHVHLGWH